MLVISDGCYFSVSLLCGANVCLLVVPYDCGIYVLISQADIVISESTKYSKHLEWLFYKAEECSKVWQFSGIWIFLIVEMYICISWIAVYWMD